MKKYPALDVANFEFNEEGSSLRKMLNITDEEVENLAKKMQTVTEKVLSEEFESMGPVYQHLLPLLTEKEFILFALTSIENDVRKFVRYKSGKPDLADLLSFLRK